MSAGELVKLQEIPERVTGKGGDGRARAIKMGMKWHADGRGLERAGSIIPIGSEQDVFQALGMPYIEPEKREVTS